MNERMMNARIFDDGILGGTQIGSIKDGTIYEGTWMGGTPVGRIDSDGNVYEGTWMGGNYAGKITDNGEIRKGWWLGGKRVGRVVFDDTSTYTSDFTPTYASDYSSFSYDIGYDVIPERADPPKERTILDLIIEAELFWFWACLLICSVIGIIYAFKEDEFLPIIAGLIIGLIGLFPRALIIGGVIVAFTAAIYAAVKEDKESDDQQDS